MSYEIAADESVELRDHDPEWRDTYEAEGIRILEALGDSVREIEHVGSTAIEELIGRPVVDIMVGVDNLEAATQHVVRLQELGYEYFGEAGLEKRRFFRKRDPEAFNLEVLLHRGWHWRARRALREYLRNHSDAARELGSKKRELVEGRGADGLLDYNEQKRPLLEEWSERALDERDMESEP